MRFRSPKTPADLLLLAAVSLWALNYSVIKVGVSQISPLAFAVLRFGLSGLAMAAILRWREGRYELHGPISRSSSGLQLLASP